MDIQMAKQIFDASDGIMKAKEILDNKIHSYYLANLVKQGQGSI